MRKINRNVVVGFAGDTLAAVQIINAVDAYPGIQYLTLEKVVKILQEKAATVEGSRTRKPGRTSSFRGDTVLRIPRRTRVFRRS